MNAFRNFGTPARRLLLWLSAMAVLSGCQFCKNSMPTPPLGTHNDPIWRRQEAAPATDMTIYQHEFEMNGPHINAVVRPSPRDCRPLALRRHAAGHCRRSSTSQDPQSEFKYPVNPNSDLDLHRREMVVQMLAHMGIPNADGIVVVAPAVAEGYTAIEASEAYQNGMFENGNGQGNGGSVGGRRRHG